MLRRSSLGIVAATVAATAAAAALPPGSSHQLDNSSLLSPRTEPPSNWIALPLCAVSAAGSRRGVFYFAPLLSECNGI
jgi:hypothetical protein